MIIAAGSEAKAKVEKGRKVGQRGAVTERGRTPLAVDQTPGIR